MEWGRGFFFFFFPTWPLCWKLGRGDRPACCSHLQEAHIGLVVLKLGGAVTISWSIESRGGMGHGHRLTQWHYQCPYCAAGWAPAFSPSLAAEAGR